MLAKTLAKIANLDGKERDRQIIRLGLIAELDAINLYQQMAVETDDKHLQEVLLDIAAEEKEHVGEFEAMLMARDAEQVEKGQEGKAEVEEMAGDE